MIEILVKVLKLVNGDTKPTMGYGHDTMDYAKLVMKERSRLGPKKLLQEASGHHRSKMELSSSS